MEGEAVKKMLKAHGFKTIIIENIIKTYGNRALKLQYLVVEANK